jgi:hypothetical protein
MTAARVVGTDERQLSVMSGVRPLTYISGQPGQHLPALRSYPIELRCRLVKVLQQPVVWFQFHITHFVISSIDEIRRIPSTCQARILDMLTELPSQKETLRVLFAPQTVAICCPNEYS